MMLSESVQLIRDASGGYWQYLIREISHPSWNNYFYFFLFSLIIYHAASERVVTWFRELLAPVGVNNLLAIEVSGWPTWLQLFALFIARDFIHWNVHRLHPLQWSRHPTGLS